MGRELVYIWFCYQGGARFAGLPFAGYRPRRWRGLGKVIAQKHEPLLRRKGVELQQRSGRQRFPRVRSHGCNTVGGLA